VAETFTVIVGAADTLPALRERMGSVNGAVLTFSDGDAIDALNTITTRRAGLVVIERLFAMTSRGAALINRIKADPALKESEIRVLAHNSDYARVIARLPPKPAPALDQRGTRRAARFVIAAKVTVIVDGKQATLVDLSSVGAQVVSPGVLKPNQRVAVAITDDLGGARCSATVAWTKFEMRPTGGPVYRAGIDFENADAPAVDAFCARHRT
jgi:PilZ domain